MTRGSSAAADTGDPHASGGNTDQSRQASIAASVTRPGAWAAYGACLWALLFAALSFYWAAGGRIGEGTIGAAVEEPALAREPAFVALLWATAILKVIAAALALALVRGVSGLPRWLLLVAGWGAAGLLMLYGLANLTQHLLIVAGWIKVPAGLGEAALPWHLLLWDPIWVTGGVLFTLAAIRYTVQSR